MLELLKAYDRALYAGASPKFKRKLLSRKIMSRLLPFFRMLYSSPDPTPCDVLFLHGNTSTRAKIQALSKFLEHKGLTVQHEVMSARSLLARRMFCRPDRKLSGEFVWNAAFARFLVMKYRPKVVCCFTHSCATFIRQEVHNITGGKTIYLAHGFTPQTIDYSIFDFDYYFVFGESSLKNIMANPVRIGHTKAVINGSPFVALQPHLSPNYEKKNVLLFSTWAAGFRKARDRRNALRETAEITVEWAKKNPQFGLLIKIHPREDPEFMETLTQDIPNITVLEKSVSMVDALRDVSLVLSAWSTASIEAALLNRPSIFVDPIGKSEKYLSINDFSLARVTNADELQHRIGEVFAHYDEYIYRAQQFAAFHLAHPADSVEFMADCIASVHQGEENFACVDIQQELSGLQPYL